LRSSAPRRSLSTHEIAWEAYNLLGHSTTTPAIVFSVATRGVEKLTLIPGTICSFAIQREKPSARSRDLPSYNVRCMAGGRKRGKLPDYRRRND